MFFLILFNDSSPVISLTVLLVFYIQGKREVRVLFVNCCRIYPKECLDVIRVALQSIPAPLIQGKQYIFQISMSSNTPNIPCSHVTLFHSFLLNFANPQWCFGALRYLNDQYVGILYWKWRKGFEKILYQVSSLLFLFRHQILSSSIEFHCFELTLIVRFCSCSSSVGTIRSYDSIIACLF